MYNYRLLKKDTFKKSKTKWVLKGKALCLGFPP